MFQYHSDPRGDGSNVTFVVPSRCNVTEWNVFMLYYLIQLHILLHSAPKYSSRYQSRNVERLTPLNHPQRHNIIVA